MDESCEDDVGWRVVEVTLCILWLRSHIETVIVLVEGFTGIIFGAVCSGFGVVWTVFGVVSMVFRVV